MYHRRTPAAAARLVRTAYAAALLVALAFGVVFGFLLTQWVFGPPLSGQASPLSPFYREACVHWAVSCALASCLLTVLPLSAGLALASALARDYTPIDEVHFSWMGQAEVGVAYAPSAQRARQKALLADLQAYAATSAAAHAEVENFLAEAGPVPLHRQQFLHRDAAWVVTCLRAQGQHSRYASLDGRQS